QDFGFFRKLWDMTIYLSKKPSPDEYDLYIRETLKQRNLVDIDWGLAVLNMGFTANAYSQGNHSIDLVKCRCMFTSGDKDMVVPYYMVKENTDAVNNSITVLYRDCGHSPFTDCPDKLTEDILNFISDN
ncbi:MAG: alpha/beta hydrolase, partial [Christensenellales bacterium]